MVFNDEFFMLKNEPAKILYKQIKNLPIFDYHCHLDPKEIFEDKVYENIVDLWLSGDHYKWRLMRANGIAEEYITGNAPKLEKFKAWAETVGKAYGNPLYHWTHLELRHVFGITDVLSSHNAEAMYYRLNELIKKEKWSPRKFIQLANVKFIGTTDHPLDDLEWHQKLCEDRHFETIVAPTFRPDEVFVEHQNFSSFITQLEDKENLEITNFDTLVFALEKRIQYFAKNGCCASDISFGKIFFQPATKDELDSILQTARTGKEITQRQIQQWQTAIFESLCKLYKENGLVTQVHFGALRNNETGLFRKLGADIGVDSMGDQISLADNVNQLLDNLVQKGHLPKMIWYNLNPTYNTILANTLANFQGNVEGIKSRLQFGAAWWFADTKLGMIEQMNALAEQGLLANFVGMLTDSRSFLSYQRHDYFRRILCSYIGQWIVDEEIPEDYRTVGEFISNICYQNAVDFFK